MKNKIMSRKNRAVLLIICSAFFFALMNLFVRLSGDIPPMQKSFFRNFVALFFALGMIIKTKTGLRWKKGNLKYLLIRSAAGTIGILCNFYAIDHIPLANASMLNKMSPFFVILFSIIILKEKLTVFQGLTVTAAFIGTLFIIKPSFSNMEFMPSAIALAGGIFAGFAYTIVRKLGSAGEKGPLIVFFFSGFSCLTTAPYLIVDFHPMTAGQLIMLLLAGFAAAGGQFTITAAYSYAPAREISVYDYSQILFATSMGAVILSELPDVYSFVGYAIIITAAVLMFLYNNNIIFKGLRRPD